MEQPINILLASNHRYPAETTVSCGKTTQANPSGAVGRIHDLLARGLAESGHTVYYLLEQGATEPLPPGVQLVTAKNLPEVDICHNITSEKVPWVKTHHGFYGDRAPYPTGHSIFVSRALAQAHNYQRFVWNGLDPQDYIYSTEKSDYLVFIGAMQGPNDSNKYHQKGLEVALALCQKSGCRLIVAGTAVEAEVIKRIDEMCKAVGAQYIGDVRGQDKARLLAHAKGLLFPTQVNEGFGLVMAEALLSGTPVICSDLGACPELVPSDTGFVCSTETDYLNAIEQIDTISAQRCREVALERYHYRRMCADYVNEYQREIDRHKLNL
ncbi:MAG: glycosyltransferase [Algicola sp.]|nr:glycosyltransferase [Algicola sp.]